MAMYVIADLHLHPHGESLLHAFDTFVSKLQSGDELYILGDLFNFFVGLDRKNKAQLLVRSTLEKARDKGIISYFIRGNRDFMMNTREAKWLNMELLADISLVRFGSQQWPVLLSHGDLFCSNDLDYMNYYHKVHNPVLQCLFRALPIFVRRKIANNLREQSMHTDRSKGRDFYGVVDQTMDSYAKEQSLLDPVTPLPIPLLVHGHIHEFGQHTGLQNILQRYVVGAWGEKFSYFKLSEPRNTLTQDYNLSKSSSLDQFVTFAEYTLDYLDRQDFKL